MSDNPTFAEIQTALRALLARLHEVIDGQRTFGEDQSKLLALVHLRFDQLSSDQTQSRSEIMDRIDRLQETVELVREDARVNWATADTAMSRVRNSREDIEGLFALIKAMEHRYQTLAAIVDGLRTPPIKSPDNG